MPRASIKWVIKHDEKLCNVEMSEQTRITRVLEYWCCLFSRSSEVQFEVNLIPSLLDYIYFVDILYMWTPRLFILAFAAFARVME